MHQDGRLRLGSARVLCNVLRRRAEGGPVNEEISRVAGLLGEWCERHANESLPWRTATEPWPVLIAAVLLRKTTTKQVSKVYGKFLAKFPTPGSLASASPEEVEEVIRPLGMEKVRSRLLVEMARELVDKFGGEVPCEREKLEELPGVGPYAASEVLLAYCGKPEPLVDTNVARALSRVFGLNLATLRSGETRELLSLARRLVDTGMGIRGAKEFAYCVLDFARKVCTARRPKCEECPLIELCSHFASRTKR